MQDTNEWEEDKDWRGLMARESHMCVSPNLMADHVAPAERPGALWDLFRRLYDEGWACDADGYTTSFRVPFPQVERAT